MSNKQLLEDLKLYIISLKNEWKFDILLNLYKLMEISQIILFCKNKKVITNKNFCDKSLKKFSTYV